MSRSFGVVLLTLTAVMAFLLGITTGKVRTPAPATSAATDIEPQPEPQIAPAINPPAQPAVMTPVVSAPGMVNFADVAESINPAVVNIEATSRSQNRRRRSVEPMPFEGNPQGPSSLRPQSGSGFVIEADGQILTNYHVIQNAERIMVKFSDGRNLQAHVLGIDPDTDIALIKVDAKNLSVAPMGDSESLRVGEWVCAIGNPLAYEHTVTVGVVSFLGRKLFDSSLDDYIQTDAAINFGNSGGPLINGRGEVVGINSAISQKASNIGFAVPINEARAILPQLRTEGRVARGFMGVVLTDVDPGSSALASPHVDSGRARAGRHERVARSPRRLARVRSHHRPSTTSACRTTPRSSAKSRAVVRARWRRLKILRDGQAQTVTVRLGERPSRQPGRAVEEDAPSVRPSSNTATPLGLSVRDIDRATANRLRLPDGVSGVVVTRVDPLSAATTPASSAITS